MAELQESQRLLWTAIYCRQFDKFRSRLEKIISLNNISEEDYLRRNGDALFITAAANGCTNIVSLLLEKTTSLPSHDAFMTAIWGGHFETTKFLIEKADNGVNNVINDALILAAARGHTSIVELLVKEGAKIDARNDVGLNALMQAVRNSNGETARFLLDQSADLTTTDYCDGSTALHWAISGNGDVETVSMLINYGAEINCENRCGETPLGKAAWLGGDVEICRLLIEHGADVNCRDKAGWTPFIKACRTGNLKLAEILLENDAVNINDTNEMSGETALMWSCGNGHIDVVRLLLERGADVGQRDDSGKSAIHWASASRCADGLQLLIDAGADVNDCCHDDAWTPLIILAANDGPIDSARILLENGAEVNLKTATSLLGIRAGWTALMIAIQRRNILLAELLQAHGADAEMDCLKETALMTKNDDDNSIKQPLLC